MTFDPTDLYMWLCFALAFALAFTATSMWRS
jgi:hypothetical protein